MKTFPLTALYVHVPFCASKCRYCDFYSVVGTPEQRRRYVDALRTEIDRCAGQRTLAFTTVYIGGGTPTVLDADELDRLLSLIRNATSIADDAEFTVEANPGTLTERKLRVLTSHGVNRLSIGAQSFDDRLLRILGRRHTRKDIAAALDATRSAGIVKVSLDLIFAIPTQTRDDWRRDLDALLACDVAHVSTYGLTWEEGTPLAAQLASGGVARVEEEDELWMYETAINTFTSVGYEHYEISNFARKGFACAHNEVYWSNEAYLGLGPSAVSYTDGERRRNVASIEAYARALEAGESPVDFRECLTGEKHARETAIMKLRRTRGIDLDAFRRDTGFDAEALGASELQACIQQGLIEISSGRLRLTREGLMVADTVLSELT